MAALLTGPNEAELRWSLDRAPPTKTHQHRDNTIICKKQRPNIRQTVRTALGHRSCQCWIISTWLLLFCNYDHLYKHFYKLTAEMFHGFLASVTFAMFSSYVSIFQPVLSLSVLGNFVNRGNHSHLCSLPQPGVRRHVSSHRSQILVCCLLLVANLLLDSLYSCWSQGVVLHKRIKLCFLPGAPPQMMSGEFGTNASRAVRSLQSLVGSGLYSTSSLRCWRSIWVWFVTRTASGPCLWISSSVCVNMQDQASCSFHHVQAQLYGTFSHVHLLLQNQAHAHLHQYLSLHLVLFLI